MMLRWASRIGMAVLPLAIISGAWHIQGAKAQVIGCSALWSQNMILPGTQSVFNLQVNNGDGNPIEWIKLTRPNGNFEILNATSQDWTPVFDASSVTLTGSSLNSNAAYNKINIDIQAAASEFPPAVWTVQAANNPAGNNPLTCADVGLGMAITDGTPPVFSDIVVDNIQSQSVRISWVSDEPATTQLQYGKTNEFGATTPLDASLKTSHSVMLTGLSASTTYYFQVLGSDYPGNPSASGEGSFTTSAPKVASANPGLPLKTIIPFYSAPIERVPPTVSISTDTDRPFRNEPVISGEASDNDKLAALQYSIDDGRNWLPIHTTVVNGGKTARFSFALAGLGDGNYILRIMAIDASGNRTVSEPKTVVIDRQQPEIGSAILSLGPQILTPGTAGSYVMISGVKHQIAMSEIGGTVTMMVIAKPKDTRAKPLTFSIAKSENPDFWKGAIAITEAGDYELIGQAIDGAANKVTRPIGQLSVSKPSRTLDAATGKPLKSTIHIYMYEPAGKRWILWDGSSYNQKNPASTGADGSFNYSLPPGSYYLRAEAPGHATVYSDIFRKDVSGPLAGDIAMQRVRSYGLGPVNAGLAVPEFRSFSAFGSGGGSQPAARNSLVGSVAPYFSLQSTAGKAVRSTDLLGKPTLLTLTALWAPNTSEQLRALETLQNDENIQVLPVAVHENSARIKALNRVGGSPLEWLADPDGLLVSGYGVTSPPTHVFMDRKGIVRQVWHGNLTAQQIRDRLEDY